jgi:5,6,7,8-tetrahydromethanopterin hydro-lyase
MLIGEGFAGTAPNAAHINLLLGAKDGPMGTAFAVAAASPGQGHVPFQVVFPAEARQDWLAIACAWVHWDAGDADAVFVNNRDATLAAVRSAMRPTRISLEELQQALATQGNAFHTPRR